MSDIVINTNIQTKRSVAKKLGHHILLPNDCECQMYLPGIWSERCDPISYESMFVVRALGLKKISFDFLS